MAAKSKTKKVLAIMKFLFTGADPSEMIITMGFLLLVSLIVNGAMDHLA